MHTRTASLSARKDSIMDAKNWIAISAASALGLGVMAAGAVSTASALPLIASATNLEVPGITVTDDDVKGSANVLDFSVSTSSTPGPDDSLSPTSSSSPDDNTSPDPTSSVSPASPPSAVSPASPVSVDEPDDNSDDDSDSDSEDDDDSDSDSDDDSSD